MTALALTFLAGCLLTGEAVWLGILRPLRRERDAAEAEAERNVTVCGDCHQAWTEALDAATHAFTAEQDAHRATGAELSHAEGQAASLRDALAATRAALDNTEAERDAATRALDAERTDHSNTYAAFRGARAEANAAGVERDRLASELADVRGRLARPKRVGGRRGEAGHG